MKIKNVQFIPIRPINGLIGFATIEFPEISIQNIGVYTRLTGKKRIRITIPTKKLRNGVELNIINILSKSLFQTIEESIEKYLYEINYWGPR